MILFFEPVFMEKMWGGNRLHEVFGYDTGEHTGECWGISAHPHGKSLIRNGIYKGISLDQLWAEHRELFGMNAAKEFPILVKLIDAADDLSIQVHPNDQQAASEHSKGKNECWYILDAKPDTDIIIGHKAKTKAEFMEYIDRKDYHHLIRSFPIKKGDFFYIEAGTLHAICRGTLLLEIQQSSDITYRFYDYDRLYHGKKRELNLTKAISVTKIPDAVVRREVDPAYFNVRIVETKTGLSLKNDRYGTFFVVLEGTGSFKGEPMKKGDFGFVSADETELVLAKDMKLALIYLA